MEISLLSENCYVFLFKINNMLITKMNFSVVFMEYKLSWSSGLHVRCNVYGGACLSSCLIKFLFLFCFETSSQHTLGFLFE